LGKRKDLMYIKENEFIAVLQGGRCHSQRLITTE